jgi:hypothetical protein
VTGAAGLPELQNAGNVLLPRLDLKLSFRMPPTNDPAIAAAAVKKRLEADPPYGAKVGFDVGSSLAGWNAPALAPWLERSMREASTSTFGRDTMYLGTGGSIPFIGMLGERFPGTQFLVTGVLGPHADRTNSCTSPARAMSPSACPRCSPTTAGRPPAERRISDGPADSARPGA